MSFGLNKAQIIGRLGADVTINHLQNGGRVANLSVATDESYIDRNGSGERIDRTEWHRVVTFQDGLIDMLARHATKGRLVYIDGKLQTRRWSKPGEASDRFSTEILLVPGGRVQFLDKANGNAGRMQPGPDATSDAGPCRPAATRWTGIRSRSRASRSSLPTGPAPHASALSSCRQVRVSPRRIRSGSEAGKRVNRARRRGSPLAHPSRYPENPMSTISFRRIAPDESRIYRDGDHVGDVHAFDDSTRPGHRVFAIHLDEDPRGPMYLHDRTRIRETARQRVDSHPLWN